MSPLHLLKYKKLFFLLWCLGITTLLKAQTSEVTQLPDSVTIKDIFIIGNKVTIDKIIFRELSFSKGDKIKTKNLKKFFDTELNKIINTDLFHREGTRIEFLSIPPDGILVQVFVNEKWYLWPLPILEIADRNFNQWWNNRNRSLDWINYGMFFKKRNFRGRKETLVLRLQSGFTRMLQLRYNVPFIDKKQSLSLSFRAGYSERRRADAIIEQHKPVSVGNNDNVVWSNYNASVELGKRIGFYKFHKLNVFYNSTEISDSIYFINPDYFYNNQKTEQFIGFEYAFLYDKRNFITYPTSGEYFALNVSKIGLGIYNDVNSLLIESTFAKYIEVSNFLSIEGISQVRLAYPYQQSYAFSFALDNASRLIRGYDNYIVQGQHLGLLKTTLRGLVLDKVINIDPVMPINQFDKVPLRCYLKVFCDIGYVKEKYPLPENQRLSNTLLSGFGVGIDIVSFYNSVLRFEWSYNIHDKRIPIQPFFYFSSNL